MNKDYLIQLTNSLYHLTLLFPKKEPLRYKMREMVDDILADLILLSQNSQKHHQSEKSAIAEISDRVVGALAILDGFFEVAKTQNWVSPVEILRIQEEYNRIKVEIKKISKHPPAKETAESVEVKPLQNLRQEKILEILKEKGKVQVWEIKQVFPEVSKRTLRRDFKSLLKQGIIERIGKRNETFYQLKR